MVLGSFSKEHSVPLSIASMSVERVPVYKLLGVTVNSALKWDDHVAAIKSKAAKRLWFLKKLKRAGVSVDDLIYYYQAVIRPLLEYAIMRVSYGNSVFQKNKHSHLKMFIVVRYKLFSATLSAILRAEHWKYRY